MDETTPPLTIGRAATRAGLTVPQLRRLTDAGRVRAHVTPGGHRRYDPGLLDADLRALAAGLDAASGAGDPPDWTRTDALPGLAEHDAWARLRDAIEERAGDLPARARTILAYGVTETVNNAIDHSRGERVTTALWILGRTVRIRVTDDGVGAFATMRDGLGLPDAAAAVVELTKGKRTTAPERHAGEGLFFTSKAVDVFDLRANGFRLVVDNLIGDVAFGSSTGAGTVVDLRLDLDTDRELVDLFARHTDDDLRFVRTSPVVKLVSREGEFISRSEAKRFAAGLERFEEVTLDFDGLDLIGQGFADELFRVWHRAHPGVTLHVANASPGVALMIGRVDREREGDGRPPRG